MPLFSKAAPRDTREKLASDGAERERLRNVATNTRAAKARADAVLKHAMTDTTANSTMLDAEWTAARQGLVTATKADTEAAAALAAHEALIGNLSARAEALRLEENYQAAEQVKADQRADVIELLRLSEELEAVQGRLLARRAEAYKRFSVNEIAPGGHEIQRGAGLLDVSYPPGIFDDVLGHQGNRNVFHDHVALAAYLAYDGLRLPAELTALVVERVKQRPRWYACSAHAWDVQSHRPKL
jgi:hypothetical protein